MINFTQKRTLKDWLKKSAKMALLCFSLIFGLSRAQAQLTVTVTNASNTTPNLASSYSSLASAITGLNAVTAFSGPVTLTCSGTSETAPTGGFVITYTAATTATNNVVINGGNTTIRAAAIATAGGAATGQADAVIKIVGSDNLTIQNFTITENSSNTVEGALAAQKMTEFGIALFAASATDGAQNNTIQNNTITMSNGATTYRNSVGIFSTCASAHTAPATARLATSTAGTNSNNKIYGNTISGVAAGVYFVTAPETVTVQESGNDVGGSSSATGNTITYGVSNTAFDMTYNLASTTVSIPCGVAFRNGAGNNIRFNTITNVSTLTQSNAGIFCTASTAPVGITYTNNYSDNNITINITASVAVTGIDFGSGLSTGSITCNNNKVTLNHNVITAQSATDYGIKMNFASGLANINNNVIKMNETVTTTTTAVTNSGAMYALYLPTGGASNSTINVLGDSVNIIRNTNATSGAVATFSGISYAYHYTASSIYSLNIGGTSASTGNVFYTYDNPTGSGASASTFTGSMYCFYGTGAVDTILNISYNTITTGRNKLFGTQFIYGFYNPSAKTTLNIDYNNVSVDRTGGTTNGGSMYCFYSIGGTSTTVPGNNVYSVSYNTINYTGQNTTTTGTFYGIYMYDGSSFTNRYFTNNNISASGNMTTLYGIYQYNGNIIDTNNTFNLSSNAVATATIYGIYQGSTWNSGNVYKNTFSNLAATGVAAGAPTIAAIYLASTTTTTLNVRDNVITNISCGNSSGSGTLNGIYLVTGGATTNIYRNKIYNLNNNSTGTAAAVYLIRITSGQANGTANIYNNLLSHTSALTGFTNPVGINGIYSTSAVATFTMNVYYNTIYLSTTSSGANFGGYGIFHTTNATATTATLNLRNNIIVNNITPSGTGFAYAFKRSSTDLSNFGSSSNNNLFYCSTGLFNDGTNTDLAIGDYKTRVSPREGNSVNEPLTWLNNSNPTGANFLQLNPSTPTQVESGALAITGFNDDYNANGSRASFPLSGQTYGGGSAPDLGAQEMDLPPADLSGPSISYTPIASTTNTSAVTLTATISDASGIATSGIGLPVLYWRTGNTGSYAAVSATWVSGSTYTFTFGGGVVNDQIQYYIAAQDNAATPNVSISPSAGSNGNSINPPACSTPPTTPARYTILSTWSGTYVIGGNGAGPASGADYVSLGEALADVTPGQIKSVYLSNGGSGYATAPTITFTGGGGSGAAATAYVSGGVITRILVTSTGSNYSSAPTVVITSTTGTGAVATANVSAGKVLNGATTLSLSSNYDGTLYEGIFPIRINEIGQTATNTLTIKPGTGANPTIIGNSATAIIDLYGADYTTIDGSSNGTASRSLTVKNTSTGTYATVIKVTSLGLGAGATNNTIKNLNIANNPGTAVNFGIFGGGLTIISSGADNDTLTIQNNNIYNVVTGMYIYGTTAVSAGANDNLTITKNNITINTSAGPLGIQVGYALNSLISGNTLDVIGGSTNSPVGISLETGFLNSVVENNKIIRMFNTYGYYGSRGITIGTGNAASNLTIRNNVVSGLISHYTTSTVGYSITGIFAGVVGNGTTFTTVAGGINMYNNSVYLSGNYQSTANYALSTTSTQYTYGVYIGSGVSALDFRNNVVMNDMVNPGATKYSATPTKAYSIYSAAAKTAFTNIDYNTFYSPNNNSQGVAGYLAGDDSTLVQIQAAFGSNTNSIVADPQYNSAKVLMPNIGSPIIAAGTPISGLTLDILGATRSNTAPSMGAYENGGDGAAPVITYTALKNTQASSSRSFTADIQDLGSSASGLNLSTYAPMVYFKKSTDANAFGVANNSTGNGWKYVVSSSTSIPFTMTLDYSLLQTSINAGDVIQYFVAAQDNAGNFDANPSTGISGTDINNLVTSPGTPNSFIIVGPPLNGGYTIGTSVASSYPTITAADLDLSLRGVSGPVVFELVDTAYTEVNESFPIVLGAVNGASATNTITFRPTSSATSVRIGDSTNSTASTTVNQGIFSFENGSYYIIDGRAGGTGTTPVLNIVQNNTSGYTIRLLNDSRFNTVTYNNLKNCGSSNVYPNIYMPNTAANALTINGNDSNTFSYNNIGPSKSKQYTAIYVYGTSDAIANDYNIYIGNNIFDYQYYGVYHYMYNANDVIQGNSLYQTAPTSTLSYNMYNYTPNGRVDIKDNFIGGSAPQCGGSAMTFTGAVTFYGVYLSTMSATTAATNVTGNTFKNINITTTTTSTTQSCVYLTTGRVHIDNNTFGSQTDTSSFVLNSSGTSATFSCVYTSTGAMDTVTINNNNFGGITFNQVAGAGGTSLRCVDLDASTTGFFQINNNLVGGTVANSLMNRTTNSILALSSRRGAVANGYAQQMNNNTIRNCKTFLSSSNIQGILAGGSMAMQCNNNSVYNLTASGASSIGINAGFAGVTATASSVTNNLIYALKTTGTSGSFIGLQLTGSAQSNITATKNFIHSMSSANAANTLNGISVNGIYSLANNMVRLGVDENGNDITTSTTFNGINEITGPSNFYYNTIYIGGAGVGSGSDSSFAFRSYVTTGTRVNKNNIFSNFRTNNTSTGKHYAIGMVNNAGLTLNNNDYYTVSSPMGLYNYADRANLGDWKTAANKDANSMIEMPAFVAANGSTSTVNLHLIPGTQSLLESGGSAVSGITTDFDGDTRPGPIGSTNGGGLSSDVGADEFDGSLFPIDMGVQTLLSPAGSCPTAGKTVSVRIKNYSLTQAINFAINPVTVYASVGGPNATSFGSVYINSGTLAIGATQDVVFTTNYDMTNLGTYTFDAYTSVVGDAGTSNDAMPTTIVNVTNLTPGTVTASETNYCKLISAPTFTTTATGGDIQWMYSTVSNSGPWTNVGTNSANYTPSAIPSTSTYFMATISCNSTTISAGDTVGIIVPQILSTVPATRCGTGTVDLRVNAGLGNFVNWYATATGGAPIYTGNTFTTPNISSTTNYYAAASTDGSVSSSIGLANNVGTTQNTGYVDIGLMFDAYVPFTLTSVNMYPVNSTPGTANITIALKNSAGTILQSTTVSVATSPSPGVKTLIPLNFVVPAGTGHRLVVTAATGLTGLTREVTTGYTFPYTVPGLASITSSYTGGASSTYYYYFYDWLIGTSCETARQMVTATVNTAPSLAISSPITNICTGQTNTSTINITSNVNDFDTYTWTPNTNISGNTASGFVFSPSVPTVYTLNASQSTGQQCVNSTSLSVTLTPLAAGTTSSSITKLCNTNGVPTLSTSATGANSYQWYSSTTSKNGPFTAVGTNSNTYTPSSNVTSTTFYMATVSCNSAPIAAGDTVEVHVPVLLSSAGGSRCGAGTVNLTASGALNDSINWYASATAVTPLYTGTTYSPSVSATTNYYVAAVAPGFSVPTNAALTATSAHSGGGATTYGATNYNDGIISAYNSLPWGWVTQGGWIEYTWNTAQNLTKVIFYKDNRPFTSMTIEYWNGSAYVPYQTGYAGTTSPVDSIIFPYVITTTKIRFNAINSTPANPNFREIEVYAGSSCESARAMVTATVNPIPSAPSAPATVSKTGTSIDVSWNSVSGATAYQLDVATDALFSSMVSGYNSLALLDTFQSITGLSGGTSYFVRVRSVNASSCASVNSSTLNDTTSSSNVNVAITAFLQGMYSGGSTMTAAPFNADGITSNTIADTINVELRDVTGTLAYSSVGTINTSGLANITFPAAAIGGSYYIIIKHRNSIATATTNTVTILANGTSYNFSNAITKAYGDNMIDDGNGVYLIFTGDINQDGSVDFNDYPNLDMASSSGVLGYDPNDLNGDASVDFNDYPLIDVNSSNGIISSLPF